MASFSLIFGRSAGVGALIGGIALIGCSAPPVPGGGSNVPPPVGSCSYGSTRPTASYTSGWATNPAFTGFNITYPSDGQGYSGMVIITGFIIGVSAMANWGPYLASKGIATMLIDPPTPLDTPPTRSTAQIAALQSLRGEATRSGSPMNGKLNVNSLAIGGWSMGGGGTLHTASGIVAGVKAAVAFAPWELGGTATFPTDHVPTLILAGGGADVLVTGSMSRGEYDSILAVPKAYVEVSGADHFQWENPSGANGLAGVYAWAWLNSFVNGDTQCRSVFARTAAMTDFAKSGF